MDDVGGGCGSAGGGVVVRVGGRVDLLHIGLRLGEGVGLVGCNPKWASEREQ